MRFPLTEFCVRSAALTTGNTGFEVGRSSYAIVSQANQASRVQRVWGRARVAVALVAHYTNRSTEYLQSAEARL